MREEKKSLSEMDLAQFTGSDIRYRHGLNRRVHFTEGVKYLADQAGAWWLVDQIAIYQGSRKLVAAQTRDDRLKWLQFWRLEVSEDSRGILSCVADSGEKPVIRENLRYTDFPLSQIDIWVGYDGMSWVLYLPSEH